MEYRLEELFDLQMGKTPSRNNPEYWGINENKWISIADLSKCGKYIYHTKECLSDVAVTESGISQIPANTVVMSFKLSIGKTAITPEPMYSNEAIMSFRDKHTVALLPEYVYYLLLAHDWDEGTNKAVMGKTLNKATLSKVRVDVHPVEKQTEIVEVLNKASAIIEARQQELQKLNELIKARFVEMFGDINKPKWETKSFENEVYFQEGPGVRNWQFRDAGIKLINIKNIVGDKLCLENTDKYLEIDEVNQKYKHFLLNAGDYVMASSGVTWGKIAEVYDEHLPLCLNTSIIRLVPKDKIEKKYLFHFIKSNGFRMQIKRLITGSAQPNFGPSHLKQITIPVPPKELQEQFEKFVKQVDKSKFVVQKSLEKYQLLFDSLMQEYFG